MNRFHFRMVKLGRRYFFFYLFSFFFGLSNEKKKNLCERKIVLIFYFVSISGGIWFFATNHKWKNVRARESIDSEECLKRSKYLNVSTRMNLSKRVTKKNMFFFRNRKIVTSTKKRAYFIFMPINYALLRNHDSLSGSWALSFWKWIECLMTAHFFTPNKSSMLRVMHLFITEHLEAVFAFLNHKFALFLSLLLLLKKFELIFSLFTLCTKCNGVCALSHSRAESTIAEETKNTRTTPTAKWREHKPERRIKINASRDIIHSLGG